MNWIFQIGAPNSKPALANPALQQALAESGRRIREHADSLPVRPGNTPLRVVPEYESWLIEAMRSGPESSVLAQEGHVGGRPRRRLRRCARAAHHRLVRLVDAPGNDELRGPFQGQEVAAETGDRALDARRAKLEHGRRSRIHSRGRHRPAGVPAAVVRSLAQRRQERRRTTIPPCCCTSWAPATTAAPPAGGSGTAASGAAEREWPLARARATTLYLAASGTLAQSAPESQSAQHHLHF